MPNSFNDVFAAHFSSAHFSIEDCRQLDTIILGKPYHRRDRQPLSEPQLLKLQSRLIEFSQYFSMTKAIGPDLTPKQQLYEYKSALSGIQLFMDFLGIDEKFLVADAKACHFLPGGIFVSPSIDWEPIIAAVSDIHNFLTSKVELLEASEFRQRCRKSDLIFGLFIFELGQIYNDFWGKGRLTVSVNGGKGGPAVRYFEFVLNRIDNKTWKPQAIKDAIKQMRAMSDDLYQNLSDTIWSHRRGI